jgi:uncharacterized protein
VFTWPDRDKVQRALIEWAAAQAAQKPALLRIGYFGSYARGNWGVGSDLDLIVIVAQDDRPFTERGQDWDASALPVPADVLVYTEQEWDELARREARFYRTVAAEAIWVYSSNKNVASA